MSAATETTDAAKARTTLTAQFALLEFELHWLPDGGAVVQRWGQIKALADVDAARAFLAMVSGREVTT